MIPMDKIDYTFLIKKLDIENIVESVKHQLKFLEKKVNKLKPKEERRCY